MSQALEGLKPGLVWKYFGEIAKIPRCSNTKRDHAYVVATAKKLGLEVKTDKYGNARSGSREPRERRIAQHRSAGPPRYGV